jgi:hypothetical protein
MIYVKIHVHKHDRILAACDEEVLGKIFSGNDIKIEVSEGFYGGELISEEDFVERTKSVSIMNLVGNAVVERAIAEGIVSEEYVLEIGEIKHAQVVVM